MILRHHRGHYLLSLGDEEMEQMIRLKKICGAQEGFWKRKEKNASYIRRALVVEKIGLNESNWT